MSTTDDVAPVAAVLAQVNGDPDALGGIAAKWRESAGQSDTGTDELMASVNSVDGAWDGASADAFVGYMRNFGEAGDALYGMLAECANQLDAASQALRTAKTAVQAELDAAVAEVNAYRNDHAELTEEQLQAGIKPIVEARRASAQAHADTAEGVMSGAAAAISGASGGLSPKFTDLKAPGTQDYVPSGDKSWIPLKTTEGTGTGTGVASGKTQGDGSGGFGGYGASGAPPGGNIPKPKEEVVVWIKEALKILQENGYAVSPDNPADVEKIWSVIHHESGGNPNAINLWDSNAAKGIPSKGLMQTIDPTFAAHALPGHGDIWNPVDNIIAGVKYTFDKYGSLDGHPGISSLNNGGGYKPY